MKHIKTIIFLLLLYSLTGCSYVSDYTEGLITKRASFSINAEYKTGPNRVVITWSETDLSDDFAGIEIYRSSHANDEYAPYKMIAYRWSDVDGKHGLLNYGSTKQYTDDLSDLNLDPLLEDYEGGIYFYRIGFIQWDNSKEDRQVEGSGYTTPNLEYTDFDESTYNSKTSLSKVSGYSKVSIP